MDLNNSTLRLIPMEGVEQIERGYPSQRVGTSRHSKGLRDNWTVLPGQFTGTGKTELLCIDRTLGEAQVFEWAGDGLRPLCPVLTGWNKKAGIIIARLPPEAGSQVLRYDPETRELEALRFTGQGGFARTRVWGNGLRYRALTGQYLWLSSALKPGNYLNTGGAEFLHFDGIWCRLVRLDPTEGFIQIGPDLTNVQLRGTVIAGHYSSTTVTQLFNVHNLPGDKDAVYKQLRDMGRPLLNAGDNLYGEANFYQIDSVRGLVPLGARITGLEKLWVNSPWKLYPSDPPSGELTTLIFRGNGVGFLRYDSAKGIRLVGPRMDSSPGMWPTSLLTEVVYGNFSKGREFLYYDPSIANPTSNALSDFDLCLARSQDSINMQIARSWARWMKDPIEIFYDFDKNGKFVRRKTGMEAKVGPIRLDLAEPNAKLDQVRVIVPMMQGRVVYEDDGELAEYKFSTWQFSVLMNLDTVPVNLDFLAEIDPGAGASARETIRKSGLPDSVFSTECLFLKTTDTKGRGEGNVFMTSPADAPGEAKNVMKRCVNLWRQGEVGRFLLGTVTRRVDAQQAPTFAVTSVAFHAQPNFEKPSGSTLTWLGMMEGHAMPNLSQARAKLMDSWLRPPDDRPGHLPSAVMGISRGMFMDRYLIARFAAAVGRQPTFRLDEGRPQWTFTGTNNSSRTSDDIIRRVYSQSTTWTLRLTILPNENRIAMAGDIVSQVDMDGYVHLVGWHTEWIHTRGRQNFTGEVTLQSDYSKGYFAVRPTMYHGTEGDIAVEQDDTVGGSHVLNFFESTFTGSSTAERLRNGQRAILTQVMSWLDEALRGIKLEFAQHAFIPPGGGVLAFQDPKFSRHGDILFDVVEKQPS